MSAAGPWCSRAAGGPCGSPWTWGQTGAGAALRRGRRWSGRCSRGELGEARGNGFLSALKGHKRMMMMKTHRKTLLILRVYVQRCILVPYQQARQQMMRYFYDVQNDFCVLFKCAFYL